METKSSFRTLTVAAVLAATGLAAYAVYFDYRRRNDVEFRRNLRKEKRRVDKALAEQRKSGGSTSSSMLVSSEMLREALEEIKKEDKPASVEETEAYFLAQVSMGERLSAQGPSSHLRAAMAFFRALRVYPSPVELIVIYQKTVPESIFKLVMDMTNLDVSTDSSPPAGSASPATDEESSPVRGTTSTTSSQEWDKLTDPGSQTPVQAQVADYYEHFPPKSMNVSVVTRQTSMGAAHKVLVVNQDFSAGDIIYKESPVIAALDSDLQVAGTHCSHCLRAIQSSMAIKVPESECALSSTFCSKVCLVTSKTQSTSLLFSLDPVLPSEIPAPQVSPAMMEERKQAQMAFARHILIEGRSGPVLVARLCARFIGVETNKLTGAVKKQPAPEQSDVVELEQDGYVLADHIERLRYLETELPDAEYQLFRQVLKSALPGLEMYVQDERYTTFLGKVAYNSFGVCFSGGRDDKPTSTERSENIERTRTPYGTQRQIGSALYTVSSYLTHSCVPTARPSFSSGTSMLHVIANHDLKKGDELTIAFVDVTQHEGESVVDCRRRRRMELARGWRFACVCERCVKEGKGVADEVNDGTEEKKDESKVEASVARYEETTSAQTSGTNSTGETDNVGGRDIE